MDQETSLPETGVVSLASVVERDGPLPFADVLTLGADVAGALAEEDAGHGGVQPESVMRQAQGPWILTAPGLVPGTTPVTAPELGPDDDPTPAGDVYALGATLVFALTGQAFVDGSFGGDPEPEAGPAADAAAGATDAEGTETPASEPGAAEATPTMASPQSLPDVMAAFLDTLRRTFASDPAARVTAAELAGTLRQLRNDVDRVTAAAVAPATSAVTIGPATGAGALAAVGAGGVAGAAGAAAFGADAAGAEGLVGAGETTAIDPVTGEPIVTEPDAEKPPQTFKQRLPIIVAAAAIIVAIVAVGLLLKKDDKAVVAAGPSTSVTSAPTTTAAPVVVSVAGTETSTTTSSSTTTTTRKATTTTVAVAPPPTAPPVTEAPAGTQTVTVDMSHMTNCPGCLASLRTQPQLLSQLTAQFPDKTVLWGQCWTTGDKAHDDQGFTSDQWIYIVGPVSQGWVPIHLVGRQNYGLPACPQSPTTAPPPPTTTPTTAPTTTATTAPSSTTTTAPKPPVS